MFSKFFGMRGTDSGNWVRGVFGSLMCTLVIMLLFCYLNDHSARDANVLWLIMI